jgi:hypothetical protein
MMGFTCVLWSGLEWICDSLLQVGLLQNGFEGDQSKSIAGELQHTAAIEVV